ncbi:sugar phosphate nucleotidyltransferase [Enterococcus sp. LJL90]
MKVVITMAGCGSRFKKAGYTVPKHEIMAGKKNLFQWAIGSLQNFYDEEFIFIVRVGNFSNEALIKDIQQLGIKKYRIKVIQDLTKGQADTVMQAKDFLQLDDQLLIYNIDTAIKPKSLKREAIAVKDGSIPLFAAEGEHWSFAQLSPDRTEIVKVAEKERISQWGSVGLYYFNQVKDFFDAFEVTEDEIIQYYGEFYIAPMYNYLIQSGKKIVPVFLPNESFAALGTPKELNFFTKEKLDSFGGTE